MSFAQNLFCCAISVKSSKPPKHVRQLRKTRYTLTVCYTALLYTIKRTVGTPWFLHALFGLRILLFSPFIIENAAISSLAVQDTQTTRREWSTVRKCLIGVALCAAADIFVSSSYGSTFKPHNKVSYAAAALTNDMLLGFMSGGLHAFVRHQ